MIVLVHHADAVDPSVDPQRPLSSAGRDHAVRLADILATRGLKPDAIWHSGKLRARQTAEAIWRACNPLAELSAVRGLQPSDPPGWIRDRLIGEARELVLVGHMPSLAGIAEALLEIAGVRSVQFPLHGAIAIEEEGGRRVERWRVE
jgi:phosphohistidine phosphatase